jgi:hypothetical protein
MRKPGAVSGVVGWGMLVRFGASSSPPTRGVFLNFAHFGAAAARVCFRASAVTDCCGGSLPRARSVRQCRPRPRRQGYDAIKRQERQRATQSRDPSRAEREAMHGQSLRASRKKTDRTGRQKITITRVLGPRCSNDLADSRLGPGRGPNRNPAICGEWAGAPRALVKC